MEKRLKRTVHLAIAGFVGAALVAVPRPDVASAQAQSKPQAVKTPRLYVFDMGRLPVPDPKSYGFTKDEIPAVPRA
jgi:hypothetical protein